MSEQNVFKEYAKTYQVVCLFQAKKNKLFVKVTV